VQLWEISPVGRLPPAVEAAVNAIAGMIGAADRAALASLLDAGVDADATARHLHAASAWGTCKLSEVLSGGGDRNARVRLECARGNLDLAVEVDPAAGRVRRLSLAPSGPGACVP